MNIPEAVKHYFHTTSQAVLPVVLKLRDLRNDTDFFQKVCQVAFASLQLLIMRYPGAASLSRFSFALTTANMHDFYCFLKYPQRWLFPINAKAINENAVLADVVDYLYGSLEPVNNTDEIVENNSDETVVDVAVVKNPDEIVIDIGNETNSKVDEEKLKILRVVVKYCLNAQLTQMAANNDSYRNFDELKEVLEKRLKDKKLNEKLKVEFDLQDDDLLAQEKILSALKDVDLTDLNEEVSGHKLSNWTRHPSLLERVISINWAVVDIGCVGLYLQGWGLFDTAKWANRIGQYPVFQVVKDSQLVTWVVGAVFTAFTFQLIEAVRKLHDETLSPQDKLKARWDIITSLGEGVLYGSLYLNFIGKAKFDNVYLQWFAIGSKSLGLLSILIRPKHEFFQKPEKSVI